MSSIRVIVESPVQVEGFRMEMSLEQARKLYNDLALLFDKDIEEAYISYQPPRCEPAFDPSKGPTCLSEVQR